MEEYASDPDEYYDLQHSGLIDKKGRTIPHNEQHEFMLGYREDDLDAMIVSCLAACCF